MILGIDSSRGNIEEKTGTEWYSFYLIQELKKIIPEEIEVKLYTRKRLTHGLENLPKNWKERILRWPPKNGWTRIRFSWEILLHHPDTLFVPAHAIPEVVPKRTITTIHDLAFLHFPHLYSKKELHRLNRALSHAIRRASRILTPSEFTKNELIKNFPEYDESRITTIHMGIDHQVYKQNLDKTIIQQKLTEYRINQPYILYVGRLEEKKNIIALINAFIETQKHTNNINSLVLAGKPGYGYPRIKQIIEQNGENFNILHPGWIPEYDLPMLMNGARALILPSWYEGFGMPAIEAMACGTPVIASNAGALPEITGDAALLVSPDDEGELSYAMKEILIDEAMHKRLRDKGLERAKQFTWQACALKTWETLKGG